MSRRRLSQTLCSLICACIPLCLFSGCTPQNQSSKTAESHNDELTTIASVRKYAQNEAQTKLTYYKELNSVQINGNSIIKFHKKVLPSESYNAAFICKKNSELPVTFGVENSAGKRRRISMTEGCTNEAFQAVGLPAKYFPDATSMWVETSKNNTISIVVYATKTDTD